MKNVSIDTITDAVMNYCSDDTAPRTRFLVERLVTHIHSFAKETKLTHPEWLAAIEFLGRVGDISDEHRNEYVLLSDVLGLSSLVDMIGSQHAGTSSSVLGPFHVLGAPDLPVGGDLKQDNSGATVVVQGRVRTVDGQPIKNAVIESWQTAESGLYSNVDETQHEYNLRCSMKIGDDGKYSFTSIRPAPYLVPDDGPVGDLLKATGRNAWRPSHFHFIVVADGYKPLVTEVFPSDDPYLDQDAVFGVREDLIMTYVERNSLDDLPAGLAVGTNVTMPFFTVDFDFVLVPERA